MTGRRSHGRLSALNGVVHQGIAEALTWRFGLLNLTDATYFEWWNVRGRQANDPVIDRYSSPGIGLVTSRGYDW